MQDVKRDIVQALSGVIDPEVGLDIVAMGLVYGVAVSPEEIKVTLTLTTPGCPMGGSILAMAHHALAGVGGGRLPSLELAWEPAWDPAMISPEGRRALRGLRL